MNNKIAKRISVIIILSVITACIGYFSRFAKYQGVVASREKSGEQLLVAFLDVGQGDATYIRAPNGTDVLIDAGRGAEVLSELGQVMPWQDRSLDLIIATHGDADHIGGFTDVFKSYNVSVAMDNGFVPVDQGDNYFREMVAENADKYSVLRAGQKLILDEVNGVSLEVLFPYSDTDVNENVNEGSIVLLLEYKESSFLLTGDAGIKVEEILLQNNPWLLDADVLKVGHHGSKTSTSSEFVNAVSPELAIISAGRDNRYGHPHQSVINTLLQASVATVGTYENGRIILRSDGQNIFLK